MSERIAEYIQLNDHYRLAVHYEEAPECPRGDWAMVTGFVKIKGTGDRNLIDVPAVHDDPTGRITEADSRFGALGWTQRDRFDNACRSNANLDLTERTVVRWARIFHGIHLEYDAEHGGYWFCDPTDFEANFPDAGDGKVKRFRQVEGAPANTYEDYLQDSLECQRMVIEQEQETYRQWAEGEVYGVVLEKRVRYVPLDDDGTPIFQRENGSDPVHEEWEEPEGVDSAIWGCYLDDEYTAFAVAKEHFPLPDDTESSASRQHYIDTGKYLVIGEEEHGK